MGDFCPAGQAENGMESSHQSNVCDAPAVATGIIGHHAREKLSGVAAAVTIAEPNPGSSVFEYFGDIFEPALSLVT